MQLLYIFILGFLIPHIYWDKDDVGVDASISCEDANFIPYHYPLANMERLLNIAAPFNNMLTCSSSNASYILRRNQNRVLFRILLIQGKVANLLKCKKKRCVI